MESGARWIHLMRWVIKVVIYTFSYMIKKVVEKRIYPHTPGGMHSVHCVSFDQTIPAVITVNGNDCAVPRVYIVLIRLASACI